MFTFHFIDLLQKTLEHQIVFNKRTKWNNALKSDFIKLYTCISSYQFKANLVYVSNTSISYGRLMFWAKRDNLLQINEGIYPANKVWEGVCRNHLVCPSVHPSVRPSVCFCDRVHPYLSRRETLEVLTSHENYLWHKDVILSQGHLSTFDVNGRKSAKFVSGLYLSHGETLKVLTSYKNS